MKILIVEDDFGSRKLMARILSEYGECDVAVNGYEALEAFKNSIETEEGKYDLICLDIMMPEMDGHKVLKEIRKIEKENDIWGDDATKVIMTTALNDPQNIKEAFKSQCESYIVKPVRKEKLIEEIKNLGLID